MTRWNRKPGPRDHESAAFQFEIGAGDGVGIDDQLPGQLADRGETVLGFQLAAGDGLANLASQLLIDGGAAGGVDVKFHG